MAVKSDREGKKSKDKGYMFDGDALLNKSNKGET